PRTSLRPRASKLVVDDIRSHDSSSERTPLSRRRNDFPTRNRETPTPSWFGQSQSGERSLPTGWLAFSLPAVDPFQSAARPIWRLLGRPRVTLESLRHVGLNDGR